MDILYTLEQVAKDVVGDKIKTTFEASSAMQPRLEAVTGFLANPAAQDPAAALQGLWPNLPPHGIALVLGIADGLTAQVGPADDTPGTLEPAEILQVLGSHGGEFFSLVTDFFHKKKA